MSTYSTEQIRNIALTGQGGAGKTTLADALLAGAGVISSPGRVEKGNTVCDFDAEEKAHQHSLNSAVVSLEHCGAHINLVDTPGMPDFLGHALGSLAAVETAAVVINAQRGIEMVARRIMQRAEERGLCRMIIVNRIDAENVDLPALVGQIQESFGKVCLPINLPRGGGTGVIDVFNSTEGEADFSGVREAHEAIVDQTVEVDEQLMEKYLEQGEVSPDQLHEPFEKALREGHLVPICFTSATEGVGIAELLDVITKMMPNPAEGNPKPFERVTEEGAEAVTFAPEAGEPAIAHVFKVTTDPFVGKLGIFRIHRGTVGRETQLYLDDGRKPFKVGHLFRIEGKEHHEIERGVPGDICAVAKVEEIQFNQVLHEAAEDAGVRMRDLKLPRPMSGFAIEAKSRGDEQKIAKALTAMESEDPCFRVERSAESGETVIRGLGELHLRIILEKMKHRYNVEVDTHPPTIAYHETIGAEAEGHHRHKKQTGGAGQFGEVYLRVAPLPRGEGFQFSNDIFGGAIPHNLVPAVEKGVRQMMEEGAIAGYPMQDIHVSVYDGKYHPVDSKEVAFVTAGRKAFIDAVHKAKPAILEPIVNLEITAPEENMGDLTADLSGKRGRIQGTETMPGGMILLRAQAPLGELTQYQSQLKSITGGQGSFTMEFSHYDPVPANVQQQLIARARPQEAEAG